MLSPRQIVILSAIAALFWLAATAWIRLCPAALTDPWRGSLGFIASIPVCWLCVRFGRRAADLSPAQLVPGTAVVVAVAALIDASALRWAPFLYVGSATDSARLFRLGSAWLLWGYGLSLGIALLMQQRRQSPHPA